MDENYPRHQDGRAAELLARARAGMAAALERSAVDMEFRRELLATPRAALARHLGCHLPDGLDVTFVESHGGVVIVLPDPVPGARPAAPPGWREGMAAAPVAEG